MDHYSSLKTKFQTLERKIWNPKILAVLQRGPKMAAESTPHEQVTNEFIYAAFVISDILLSLATLSVISSSPSAVLLPNVLNKYI